MNKKVFRPRPGQPYWFPSYILAYDEFIVDESVYWGDQWEEGGLRHQVLFETKAEAQEEVNLRNRILKENNVTL